MKKSLQSFLLMAFLLLVGSSAWAAGYTRTLNDGLEVSGYKAKAFYDFQNNSPEVLPTSGDLRYRDGGIWGLHNFGSGGRSGTATIPVAKGDILVLQSYTGYTATINVGTQNSNLSSSTGYDVYDISSTAESVTFTVPRYGGIVAALVMEEDESVVKSSYTLNYINGELIVKSENGELAVGATVSTDASFFVDDAKYFRKAGEPESFTVAETGNNFSVNVRPAENYKYSLVSSLGETLASGSGLEGETVYAGYPRYQLSEGNFYEAGVTNKEYRKSLVLSQNNVSATVDYAAWNGTNPVVFYAEAENIEGFTTSVYGNIPVRASNAKAGVATGDVTITSLPAGKYKLHVGIFTSKSAFADQVVNFGIGSETFAATFTGVNLNEVASDEITVKENSDVKFIAEGSWADAQFDYIYIEKTGEYVPPTPVGTYDLTLAEGSEAHGTVAFSVAGAAVTKANKDDIVTVSVTPAEGYVVTSVTARAYTSWENAARTTTRTATDAPEIVDNIDVVKQEDGTWKFTMPEANVLLQVEYTAVYAINIATGMQNGTVEGPATAAAGEKIALTVTPAEGYVLKTLKVTASTTGNEIEYDVVDYSFTMPAETVDVIAAFAKVYAVNIAEGIENGTVAVDTTKAKAGDVVTITATPAEDYELVSVSVTGVTSDESITVEDGKFTMPEDDVTVNAEFQQSTDEKVALTADMFYTWNGYGADASKISVATVDFNLGTSLAEGGVVAGTGSVDYLTYADMTGSTKVIFEGVNGTPIRLLMNRQESNSGPLVEKNATIANGKAEISLTDLTYVHINAIKMNWGAPEGSTINSIKFVKPMDPLAVEKEALKEAIAAAKLQNGVAKTEESFAALTKAISDGEAALADAEATKESLTTAKSDIETAVKGLTLLEGYDELTKEMFKHYASVDEPGEGTTTGCGYELFTASTLPYGDSNVSELNWADLTKYDKLIVTVAGTVAPRFCMNRLVAGGQQAATQEDSKMLDINPNNSYTWSTEKYQTASDGVYTIDLAEIVKDYSFARLHCIKAQGYGTSTVVTGIYLHEAPVPTPVYAVNIAEGIENGTVVAEPTSAKEGDEVTLTITPAEGYEFASVSVTGVTSDITVIVTDNKFTMPADDVTVNATFQKKAAPVIYIETDLTKDFEALTDWHKWTGATGYAATEYCPAVTTNSGKTVQVCEKYETTCANTGDVFYQTVTGLTPGIYKIELYGGAAFTFGRGFGSMAFTGEIGTGDPWGTHVSDTYQAGDKIEPTLVNPTGVSLTATTSEGVYGGEIPIYYATNFPDGAALVTLSGVVIGENGEIKIGMSKTSQSTNWHVIQLKGVTAQVRADELLAKVVATAQAIKESDVPAALYSRIQQTIADYDKEYATADEYLTAINALNDLVDIANGYAPLAAVINEGESYKANVPAESPAITTYDQTIVDVKNAYDAVAVADIPTAVKVVEAALPALAKAQTAPSSDLTVVLGTATYVCPQGNGPGTYQGVYTETYSGTAYQPGKVIYQKVEGLIPGGVYEVKFIAAANMARIGAATGDGIAQAFVNDATEGVTVIEQLDCTPTDYVRTLAGMADANGVLKFGLQNVAEGGNWYIVTGTGMTLKEIIPLYSVEFEQPENGTLEFSSIVAVEGDKVVVIATPDEGYELESLSVRGVTSDIAVQVVTDELTGEISFVMPADDVTVNATFKQITYPLSYALGMQNGTVTGPATAAAGEKVTLTVTPAEGYELETLKVTLATSGNEIEYDAVDYSFTMPKEGVYIVATFSQITGIDAASATKGKKYGAKKIFKNGRLIILDKDGNEFGANGITN